MNAKSSFMDRVIENLAYDYAILEEKHVAALAEAVTYRWLYLELFSRLMIAEDKAIRCETRVRELLSAE